MVKRAKKRNAKAMAKRSSRPTASGRSERQRFIDMVTRLADPLCSAEGLELVHVEYQREPGGLTLDRPTIRPVPMQLSPRRASVNRGFSYSFIDWGKIVTLADIF